MIGAELQKAAFTLRLGGWSLSAIAEKLGISTSSLQRLFNENSIKRGSITAKMIEAAKNELILNDDLKHQIASMVKDDLALIRRSREAIALSLERIVNDESLPVVAKARAIAALTTSLGLSQSVYRKALNVSKIESAIDETALPSLTIHYMSENDEAQVRSARDASDYDLPSLDEGEPDRDVIEEA